MTIRSSYPPSQDRNVFSLAENWWCQFVNSIAGPYCLVWAGVKVAPKHAFIVAVVLTVLFAIANGVVLTMVIITGRYSDTLWWLIISSVLGIIATIYACVHFHQEESKLAQIEAQKMPSNNF
jgi:uncharacterized membrane protein HdeD (DUF308 family)